MFGYAGLMRRTAGECLVLQAKWGELLAMFGYTCLMRGTAGYLWLYMLGEGHC